ARGNPGGVAVSADPVAGPAGHGVIRHPLPRRVRLRAEPGVGQERLAGPVTLERPGGPAAGTGADPAALHASNVPLDDDVALAGRGALEHHGDAWAHRRAVAARERHLLADDRRE